MTVPKRQHFLPRAAYLRFFCIWGTQQLYLYRRGQSSKRVSIGNVANRRYLYSFEQNGRLNHEFETRLFAAIDAELVPVFMKLNAVAAGAESVSLTPDEIEAFIGFVAYQFVRTPAFRDMRARNGRFTAASTRELSDRQIHELRQMVPPGVIPDGVVNSDEEFRELLLSESIVDVEAQFADPKSWLAEIPMFAARLFDELRVKTVELIRADGEYLITCDQPVVIDYNLGVGPSEVYFPVGSRTAVLFHESRRRDLKENPITIPVRAIADTEAAAFNRRVIFAAEDELYGAIKDEQISNAFANSPRPKRLAAPNAVTLFSLSHE